MEKKTFVLATLGCRTNQYETSAYAKQLREKGYTEAQEGEEAHLCIVNTCTVTEGADASSRRQIRSLARKHPSARLVVTGCLADRLPKEIGEIEGVDVVVPNHGKEHLLAHVFPEEEWPEFAIDQMEGHTRAFVKIQDGCNSFCTYCILPYVRGRSRSRRVEPILREIEALVASGYQEVVLTGINVGDFDGAPEEGEEPVSLAQLVGYVDQIEGLNRIRISSIDPDEVDDALLSAVIGGKKTCHSMHIVLQSGSNAILKRMNRKYTRQMFLETIDRLKDASSDFTFTTDVIVGFPGESESDFEQTLAILEEVQFAKVHMFPYSKRDRTRAALYENQVGPEQMGVRKQKVLHLSEQIAYALRERYVGRTMPVLTESQDETGRCSSLTDNFLPVFVEGQGLQPNRIVQVECIKNTPEGLIGRCVSK